MTKREAERQTYQLNVLRGLGFTREEAESLRRISMTLHRWYERECGVDGGCIERNEEGKAGWRNSHTMRWTPILDLERGAMLRLHHIMEDHKPLTTYIQGDPRGASLYIIRPGDVPDGATVDSYYSRGICVY